MLICDVCGVVEAVQKHHMKYFPEKTVPVCDQCHKLIHSWLYPLLSRQYIKYNQGDAQIFYESKSRIDKFLSYLSKKRKRT